MNFQKEVSKLGLCETYKGSIDIFKSGRYLLEPKLDGIRCIMFVFPEVSKVYSFSRNGKKLYNMDIIEQEVLALCKDFSQLFVFKNSSSLVLDGELFAKDWSLTSSIVHTHKEHPDKSHLSYYIFDIVSLPDWLESKATPSLLERKSALSWLFKQAGENVPHLVNVPYVIPGSLSEAKDLLEQLLSKGYEGAVVKDGLSPYPFSRSSSWLKWKPVKTIDVEVIEVKQGTGRNKNRLGSFICKLQNGKTFRVGGGFTDTQREEFWHKRNELIGCIVEVEYQEETIHGVPRFPRFVRIRWDKSKKEVE